MAESLSKMTSIVGSISYQQSRFSSRTTSAGFSHLHSSPSTNHSVSTSHSVIDLIRSFQLDALPRNFKYGENQAIPETLR